MDLALGVHAGDATFFFLDPMEHDVIMEKDIGTNLQTHALTGPEGEDSDEVPDWYVERVREVWRELGGEEEDGG